MMMWGVFCFCQPPTSNWHKISWINCLFFLFLCCTLLEKEDFLKKLHILSCFVPLKSVLVCFGSFFRTLAVNSVSIFFIVFRNIQKQHAVDDNVRGPLVVNTNMSDALFCRFLLTRVHFFQLLSPMYREEYQQVSKPIQFSNYHSITLHSTLLLCPQCQSWTDMIWVQTRAPKNQMHTQRRTLQYTLSSDHLKINTIKLCHFPHLII